MITRLSSVGVIGALTSYSNYCKIPTLCSDEGVDKEFKDRQEMVNYLRSKGMSKLIPKNIFVTENGSFMPIPDELSQYYRRGKDLDEKSNTKKIKRAAESSSVVGNNSLDQIPKVVAIYNSGMVSLAHQRLSEIMNEGKLKTIKDLPPKLYDILPLSLVEARSRFEMAGEARIDSKQLSSLQAEAEQYCSPVRKPSGKKIRIRSPEKADGDEKVDGDDNSNMNEILSSITKSFSVSSKQSSTHKKTGTDLRRNSSHSKCDNRPCRCNKRVSQIGCCDVCRLYFLCDCKDCMFASGKESVNLDAERASDETRATLQSEIETFSETSRKGDEFRSGYIFERRKETVTSQSESGREVHDWRVGRLSSYVQCCGNAFVRFYGTSTRTLYNMKNKPVVIANRTKSAHLTSEAEASHEGECRDVPLKMKKVDMKRFSKRASVCHSIILDDDEKASLRWAPCKGSDAVEEAYGWMHGHFGDVAEEMPNRYITLASVKSYAIIMLTTNLSIR
jgi:hypothetical protein